MPLEFTTSTVETDHYGNPDVGQELPLFVIGCLFAIYFFILIPIKQCCQHMGSCLGADEEDVDEGLGTYFECLSLYDRKRWLAEELYNRSKLGISTMTEKTLEKLRTIKPRKRTIRSTPNYEILSNDKYIAAYQFVPIALRNTTEETIVSDLITQIMYMGYIRAG